MLVARIGKQVHRISSGAVYEGKMRGVAFCGKYGIVSKDTVPPATDDTRGITCSKCLKIHRYLMNERKKIGR